MGHESVGTTDQYYGYLHPDKLHAANEGGRLTGPRVVAGVRIAALPPPTRQALSQEVRARLRRRDAYHEAAHAVVRVAAVDATFVRIDLFDDGEELEQEGLGLRARVQVRDLRPEVHAAIMEASLTPSGVRGDSRWVEEVGGPYYARVLGHLAGIAAEYRLGVTGLLDPEEELEERYNDEDGDVLDAVTMLGPLGVPIEDAFDQARALVEEPAVWAAVERLAEILLDRGAVEYGEVARLPELAGVAGKYAGFSALALALNAPEPSDDPESDE